MDEQKAKIRAYDGIFLNSSSVFVEYIDIIKCPYYIFLVALAGSTLELQEPFNIQPLKTMDIEQVTTWFYQRKHQNPLFDLLSSTSSVKSSEIDEFLDKQIQKEILESSNKLNVVDVLLNLYGMNEGLAGPLYIWYPYENEAVDEDIKKLFGDIELLRIVHGPIMDALKDTKRDSTYIFSDYANVNALIDVDKLDFSSIILPEDFNYNKEEGKDIINFEKLAKEHPFKINKFFATLTREVMVELNAEDEEEDQGE